MQMLGPERKEPLEPLAMGDCPSLAIFQSRLDVCLKLGSRDEFWVVPWRGEWVNLEPSPPARSRALALYPATGQGLCKNPGFMLNTEGPELGSAGAEPPSILGLGPNPWV